MAKRKDAYVPSVEAIERQRVMLDKAKRLERFLPGYTIMGVDPGYLFRKDLETTHRSLDLPDDVVEHLLTILEGK